MLSKTLKRHLPLSRSFQIKPLLRLSVQPGLRVFMGLGLPQAQIKINLVLKSQNFSKILKLLNKKRTKIIEYYLQLSARIAESAMTRCSQESTFNDVSPRHRLTKTTSVLTFLMRITNFALHVKHI